MRDMSLAFTPGELTVHRNSSALHKVTSSLRAIGKRVVLVPTMGALHEGHLTLVRESRRAGNTVVVVSIYVNPLQFGAEEDLDSYPRTFDADCAKLRSLGVELVFAPTDETMFPNGRRTTIHPGPLGDILEAKSRPTHFIGMLTVVAKLITIVAPHAAYFGEKDYQQLVLIQQMVTDLNLPVDVIGVPTVRESDGLAMSSRNLYLDDTQRHLATTISAALTAGAYAAHIGIDAALTTARSVLDSVTVIDVEYLELLGCDLGPPPERGKGRLLVAAHLGKTRLIDNVGVTIGLSRVDKKHNAPSD